MPKLQPGVERILESPDSDMSVTLIVGVDESSKEEIKTQINRIGDVEEELPVACLAVSVSQPNLQEICDIDGIESVEIEGTWRAEEGNSKSLPGLRTAGK